MSNRLYIMTTAYNKRVGVLFEENKPTLIRCYDKESMLGNVYLGKISNILSNINAAFVNIDSDLSCYMSLDDYYGDGRLRIGDEIIVQLTKESVKTKQPTVSMKISLTGEYVVLTLGQSTGVSAKIKDEKRREELKKIINDNLCCDNIKDIKIDSSILALLDNVGGVIRTKAEFATDEDIIAEIKTLYNKMYHILRKGAYSTIYSSLYKPDDLSIIDANFFYNDENCTLITDLKDIINFIDDKEVAYNDEICSLNALYNINGIIEKSLSRISYLKSGGYLIIEPTEAMTVIDVNSGKAIKGRDAEESRHKLNLEAAKEIARQLSLRNISGIIIVDFINVKSEIYNKELIKYLEKEVSKDYTLTNIVDITRLGLVEITRKKVSKPLYEFFDKNHLT